MTLGDSGIDNPSKLKNKTIGYPGIPLNIGILSSILAEQSLTIDDVNLVDVGFDLVPALLSERVDAIIGAFWSHESILIELETQGIKLLSPLWQESFDSDGMDSWNKFGDWMKDKGLISESLDVEKSIMK